MRTVMTQTLRLEPEVSAEEVMRSASPRLETHVSAEETNPSRTEHQQNYVTVQKPSGSTTIIINNEMENTGHGSKISTEPTCSRQPSCVVSDVAQGIHQSPVQPLKKFPTTLFGSKSRSFNALWYHKYQWLEYSVEKDAAFCYACRLFSTGATGRAEEVFTRTGYRDWKHASGKQGLFEKHSNCHAHKQAMVSWGEYKKNAQKGTTIADRLDSTRSLQIQQNRHYIRTVAEVILLCARQDIGLRGHRESQLSLNRGNFLEILSLVASHDTTVQERLLHGPKNAVYTSPSIQNSLLNVMANMVRKTICNAVREAGVFSLLADESKDCSKQEQLTIILRYVDDKAIIHENFLTYVQATSLTAESLAAYLVDTLRKCQLDPESIVSQGYDGASVMSGRCSGVQQRLREFAPHAIYIHCYAHTLNLVLVDCKNGSVCRGVFLST